MLQRKLGCVTSIWETAKGTTKQKEKLENEWARDKAPKRSLSSWSFFKATIERENVTLIQFFF